MWKAQRPLNCSESEKVLLTLEGLEEIEEDLNYFRLKLSHIDLDPKFSYEVKSISYKHVS